MPASLNGILSVARTGLLTQQLALQVVSQNLANATTPGYSRQRADLVPGNPLLQPEGSLGTGVRVADISRARDRLLDAAYRRELSLFEGYRTEHNALQGVEAAINEPGELGLGASLDAFWGAWSDLANDPISSSARSALVARGQDLVDHFHRIDASVDAVSSQVLATVQSSVGDVNRILSEVATINRQISASTSTGNSAPDLADRRDRLIDELAALVPVEVTDRGNGVVGVVVNGVSVVEGVSFTELSLSSASGSWTVETGSGIVVPMASGTVGGSLTVLNDTFVSVRADLDELARGIVERVNAFHATGTNPLGGTGINFFDDLGDPSTVTAQTFTLDAAILSDPLAISAGTPDGGGNYQAGANDVALALAGLRTDTSGSVLAGRTVNGAYNDLVATVGLSVASARESEESHQALARANDERRASVSGVATDEELVQVVQIQAAFAAASRLVTVVDEMYQTLLAI